MVSPMKPPDHSVQPTDDTDLLLPLTVAITLCFLSQGHWEQWRGVKRDSLDSHSLFFNQMVPLFCFMGLVPFIILL